MIRSRRQGLGWFRRFQRAVLMNSMHTEYLSQVLCCVVTCIIQQYVADLEHCDQRQTAITPALSTSAKPFRTRASRPEPLLAWEPLPSLYQLQALPGRQACLPRIASGCEELPQKSPLQLFWAPWLSTVAAAEASPALHAATPHLLHEVRLPQSGHCWMRRARQESTYRSPGPPFRAAIRPTLTGPGAQWE